MNQKVNPVECAGNVSHNRLNPGHRRVPRGGFNLCPNSKRVSWHEPGEEGGIDKEEAGRLHWDQVRKIWSHPAEGFVV